MGLSNKVNELSIKGFNSNSKQIKIILGIYQSSNVIIIKKQINIKINVKSIKLYVQKSIK